MNKTISGGVGEGGIIFKNHEFDEVCLKVDSLKQITVNPILLKKGNVWLALYGLSSVKDERLHRLLREDKVS